MRKKYVLANWKMNQLIADIDEFFKKLEVKNDHITVGIAPQALHLPLLLRFTASHKFLVGAQNLSNYEKGAYTGELSPLSLKDLKVDFVLIGHSERRIIFKEDDATLNTKLLNALKHGLLPVFCVGETLSERESGKTFEVISRQLEIGLNGVTTGFVIAYEPVWAIGTGKTATTLQAEEVHQFIRGKVGDISILYGGSVNPDNAPSLMASPNIDGLLVGGASLDASSFNKLFCS